MTASNSAYPAGLPAGAAITPMGGALDPGDQPGQLTRDFLITFPQGQDTRFDLSVSAFSKEKSNGDEERATVTQTFELDVNHNLFNRSFMADGRSIWGNDPAFNFHEQEFIGLDENFDPPRIDFPIPPTPLLFFGDASVDAKVGFDFEVSIAGGQLDATVPCEITIDTAYNKTCDQLLIDPVFSIAGSGMTIDAMGPGGFLRIQPIFDVLFNLQAGLNFIVDDLPIVNINQRVNPSLPGVQLDTDDAAVDIPLAPGFSLGLDFPEVDPKAGPSTTNPLVAHDESDNFVGINLDVDAFAANFFPRPQRFRCRYPSPQAFPSWPICRERWCRSMPMSPAASSSLRTCPCR